MNTFHCYICSAAIQLSNLHCPNCGKRQFLLHGSRTYHIRGILGEGGFGRVYDAYDLSLHERRCAIKEIREKAHFTNRQIAREVKVLATTAQQLNSFIPDIYEYWIDGSLHYIVMQYIDGPTLDKARPLPWPVNEVSRFLQEMLERLLLLHRHGVVHRDIKPQNIKEVPLRGYVLLDFGLAAHGDISGPHGGTPVFAPPEQWPGRPRPQNANRRDPRSDLYSLAATAHFLLTGEPPIFAHEQASGTVTLPRLKRRGIAPAFKKTLEQMLQSDPQKRPASAQAAIEQLSKHDLSTIELEEYDENEVTEPGRVEGPDLITSKSLLPSDGYTPDRSVYQSIVAPPDRGRITDLALTPDNRQLAVSSALGVTVYDLTSGLEIDFVPYAQPVSQVFYVVGGQLMALVTRDSLDLYNPQTRHVEAHKRFIPLDREVSLAVATGRDLMLVGEESEARIWQLGSESTLLTLCEDGIGAGALSPDGSLLALVTTGAIKVWQIADHQLTLLHSLPISSDQIIDLALAHQGSVLAAASSKAVEIWRLSDRKYFSRRDSSGQQLTAIALTPDGSQLAMATNTNVTIIPTSGRHPGRTLAAVNTNIARLAFSFDGQKLIGSSAEEVWIWHTRDGSMLRTLNKHLGEMRSLTFTPDGQILAAIGERVHLWRMEDSVPHRLESFGRHSPFQTGLAVHPQGAVLAAASSEGVQLWSLNGKGSLGVISSRTAQAHSVAFSADSTLIHVSTQAIERWDIHQNSQCSSIQSPLPHPFDVAFDKDGEELAIYADRTIVVMRSDGQELQRLTAANDIRSLSFVPKRRSLVAVTEQNVEILALDTVASATTIIERKAHRVVVAPDGLQMALLLGTEIELWQIGIEIPILVARLQNHNDIVNDIAFAPDSTLLVSAAQDGTVRLWRLDERASQYWRT